MILTAADVPGGAAVLNPFVVVDDASGFVDFVCAVFGGVENPRARTPTPTGQLIHAEMDLGGVTLMVSDRLEGWAARPGLLQLWVDDARMTLEVACARGARVLTPVTPFYGERNLARLLDPSDAERIA